MSDPPSNVTHRVDGIQAKILRAKEGVHDLNADIGRFLSGEPPPYRVLGHLKDDHLKYVFEAIIPFAHTD
jgi:hypothetical protein